MFLDSGCFGCFGCWLGVGNFGFLGYLGFSVMLLREFGVILGFWLRYWGFMGGLGDFGCYLWFSWGFGYFGFPRFGWVSSGAPFFGVDFGVWVSAGLVLGRVLRLEFFVVGSYLVWVCVYLIEVLWLRVWVFSL